MKIWVFGCEYFSLSTATNDSKAMEHVHIQTQDCCFCVYARMYLYLTGETSHLWICAWSLHILYFSSNFYLHLRIHISSSLQQDSIHPPHILSFLPICPSAFSDRQAMKNTWLELTSLWDFTLYCLFVLNTTINLKYSTAVNLSCKKLTSTGWTKIHYIDLFYSENRAKIKYKYFHLV